MRPETPAAPGSLTGHRWYRRVVPGVCLSTLPLFAAAAFAAEARGAIQGRVLEAGGAAVPGASVVLWRGASEVATRASDLAGRFLFSDLPPASYRLRVARAGFAEQDTEVVLAAGATREVAVTLALVSIADEIVITATRSPEAVAAIPGSVTVVSRPDLEEQTSPLRGLADALGVLVPGLAPANESTSLVGQTLRGRTVAVLIDGVPQSTSRNVQHDLATIAPSAVERLEVVRGPTAIYGDGGTGGVINILTRPFAEDGRRFTTELTLDSSLTHPEDSLAGQVSQEGSIRKGRFDLLVRGSFLRTGSFFDAQGDRHPPVQAALADSDTVNLQAKLGAGFGPHRLQLAASYFDMRQDTGYTTDPAVDRLPGRQKARALVGLKLEEPQETDNTVASLDYTHDRLVGGPLHAQVFYRDYFLRFFPQDLRNFAAFGNSITQVFLESEKVGGRVEGRASFFAGRPATVVWGGDASREETAQPVLIMDPTAYDDSGGLRFRTREERGFTPPVKQRNLALFTQAGWRAATRLVLRGGVRQERISADIDDFVTLQGNAIPGGELSYDGTLLNLGAVYSVAESSTVFLAFSQGFSLPDLGRILRTAPAGFTVLSLRPQAQNVDHYEVGAHLTRSRLQGSLALFYNTSDLGSSFAADFSVSRAPERVWGSELAVEVRAGTRGRAGGTATWVEGQHDPDGDGEYSYLPGNRIPPLKLTAFVEHHTLPGWQNRIQALYSGARDRFGPGTAFGLIPVEAYTIVDWISRVAAGRGTLLFGVENLLNEMYFPPFSQWFGPDSVYVAGRGAALRVTYSVEISGKERR